MGSPTRCRSQPESELVTVEGWTKLKRPMISITPKVSKLEKIVSNRKEARLLM